MLPRRPEGGETGSPGGRKGQNGPLLFLRGYMVDDSWVARSELPLGPGVSCEVRSAMLGGGDSRDLVSPIC